MARLRIVQIETDDRLGTITPAEARDLLKGQQALRPSGGLSQVVIGVYSNGVRTSLKGRDDGSFYFMSGNLADGDIDYAA